ncbi:MAG TPA: hypothetical protein VF337_02190 [Candidatus Limnocylindrales bacterium]
MADRGNDKDTKPVFDADLSMDEESAEGVEPEGDEFEAGDEGDEGESEGGFAATGKSARPSDETGAFHFSIGRRGKGEDETGKHQAGSVRTSHERVHIDDRLSAIYALICAGGLIGILVLSYAGGMLPKNVGPTLSPLVVPTGGPTPTPCITPTPVVTVAPTATPSALPTKSAKPTPTLAPSESAAASAVASASSAVASAQAAAVASAQASAVASFCAIPVATPTPTATPSSSASPTASAS